MQWKRSVFAVAAVAMLASAPAWAGCMPGERIDGTTADQAKRKIEAAGYADVHDLSKGCDNYWHGQAMKDGAAVNVVLSPQGQVLTEGS
jgi:hypothetical protein